MFPALDVLAIGLLAIESLAMRTLVVSKMAREGLPNCAKEEMNGGSCFEKFNAIHDPESFI